MPGWSAIPPEVNVQSLNSGAGSGTYEAAAARWQQISSDIQSIRADTESTAQGLSGNMDGATKEAANEFLHSMGTWLDHMSVAASKHSKKASEVVTAYESAKAAMVPYPIVMQAKIRSMMPGGGLFGAQALEAKAEYEMYRKVNGAAMQSYESGTLNAAMPTPVRPFTGKALPAPPGDASRAPGGASDAAAHGSPGGHSGAANGGQGATLGGYNTGGNPAAVGSTGGGGYGAGQGSTGGQAGSGGQAGQAGSTSQAAQAGGDSAAASGGSPAGAENGLGGQVGPGAGERPSTVGEDIANAFATPQGPEGVTASGLGQGGEGMPFASQTPADAPYGGLPVGQHTPNGFVPAEGVIASPGVGGAGAPVGGLGGGRAGGLGGFGGSHGGAGGAGGSAGRAGGLGGGHAGGAAGSGGAGTGSGSGGGGRIPSISGMGRGVGGGMMGSGGAGARAGTLGAAPIGQGAGRVGAGFSGIPGPENSSKAAGGGSGMRGGMMGGGGRRNRGGESGGSNPDIVVEKREVHDPVLERERARVNAERFF